MSEVNEELHIDDTQIIDVTHDLANGDLVLIAWFVGGTSTDEMTQGGRHPGLFDVRLAFSDEGTRFLISDYLEEWMRDTAAIAVIVYDDGRAQIINTDIGKTLDVVYYG